MPLENVLRLIDFGALRNQLTDRILPKAPASTLREARARRLGQVPFGGGRPELMRHPKDGWKAARAFPMSRAAREALRHMIRRMCDQPGLPLTEEMVYRVEESCRRQMSYFPPVMARGVALVYVALDWSPIWLGKSIHRLHRLPREDAEALINGLGESDFVGFRTLVFVVRGLILSTYYDQPEVHREINYAPVPFMRHRMGLRERLLKGQQPAANDFIVIVPPEETQTAGDGTAGAEAQSTATVGSAGSAGSTVSAEAGGREEAA